MNATLTTKNNSVPCTSCEKPIEVDTDRKTWYHEETMEPWCDPEGPHYMDRTATPPADPGLYRLIVRQDEWAESPRNESRLGTLWARHPRYDLADKEDIDVIRLSEFVDEVAPYATSLEDLTTRIVKHLMRKYGATVVLPVYLHDHSGLSLYTGANLVPIVRDETGEPMNVGRQGWDTSHVGFIFDDPETRNVMRSSADLEVALRGEIELYSSYLEGDVSVVILTEFAVWNNHKGETRYDWDELDRLSGIYGANDEDVLAMVHGEFGRPEIDLSKVEIVHEY